MALELVVDTLEALPETVRSLYVAADGKFRLDVSGIEDTKGLKSALDKEREAAKEATKAKKELETRFAGIDPEQVKALMSRFENDEEGKLIAAGKMDKVIENRTEKQRQEFARLMKESADKVAEADARAGKFSQRVLDNHIRAAAAKVGIHAHAVEDALYRGRNLFQLDENGDAVQISKDGQTIYGKDGKTPYTPAEWLESLKEIAPHWFPAGASGGGSSGGNSGGNAPTGKTITRKQYEAMAPLEQRSAFKAGVKVIDS